MRAARAILLAGFAAGAVLVLGGCNGGGGGGTGDATGEWEFYTTPDGGVETGPEALLVVQTGSDFTVEASTGIGAGTVSGSSVTFSTDNPAMIVTHYTGTLSGTHMEGTWENTALATGTWRAELVSRALVDVTGIWDVYWMEDGGLDGTATADLTMAPDGTITGTYYPDYGDSVEVTGSLHGYGLALTVVETSPLDRTITVLATVNELGSSAMGRWSDTYGNAGDWDATKW